MVKYKKKNIGWHAVARLLFPPALWTRAFLAAWLACAATVLAFDLLWCYQTTFRSVNYGGTWINLLLLATLMALPSALGARKWVQSLVMAVYAILGLANLMYCLTYFNAIPLASYGFATNVADFGASIIDSLRWRYLLLFLPMAVWLRCTKNGPSERRPAIVSYLLTLAALALLSAGDAIIIRHGMRHHIRKLHRECYYATCPPVVYTLFGPLLASIGEGDAPLTPERAAELGAWGADHVDLSKQIVYQGSDTAAVRNLVVVICESLESWPIEARVEGKELTPNLNRLVADTANVWYAPRVLSQTGSGRSIDGQLLMLAGMYPMQGDVYAMNYPDHHYMALPQAMKAQGAHTYLLSGDKPSSWNQGLVARAFGIDHTFMADSWNEAEKIGHPRRLSDASLMQQSVAMMKRGDIWPEGSPAYLQFVTYTGHNPFRVPDKLKTITFDAQYPDVLADYMTVTHYTDQALGYLLDYLKQRADWPQTMVVIVGDHEGLSARRMAVRSTPMSAELVEEQGYVPCIIVNGAEGGRHPDVMGQVDVYTTILDQGRLPFEWRGMGFSAIADGAPRFAVSPAGQLIGHTAGADSLLVEHIKAAPGVSNDIIRYNLLK